MGRRALAALSIGLITVMGAAAAQAPPGPRFRADGPQADVFGQREGYPACTGLEYVDNTRCRVGALSAFDTLFPARRIAAPATASPLRRAAVEPAIRYTSAGKALGIDDYLDDYPVTGLLIARGDEILVERYQYGRSDQHRLASFSMAKTIIALLIGIAADEGAIASIDHAAAQYVPALAGTEFGATPIKALLQMASGVRFAEVYTDRSSDIYTLANLTLGQGPGGAAVALPRFNTRYTEPGKHFSYSSAESLVLGLVLAGATKRTVADYAREKLWQPLGAEADASWNIDATGQEVTFAYYNAVLRDWARLGLMLAHDGMWNGQSIVSRAWLAMSTTAGPDSPARNYGYQIWLPPTRRQTIELRGLRGQRVLVDRQAKLVLVQTALSDPGHTPIHPLWEAVVESLGR
jgi:CubicO group peptidase (beta-lactamase class C family)